MNLHTKQPDKKIEHSVLKTINAFLNTNGGTLLVGISDEGMITGIDTDGFQNTDKFYQHFTNMIKNHIGNEYLPFIQSNIIEIQKKHILKIDCNPSDKAVFLKIDKDEDFYVRSGTASIKLVGKKLINYVNIKFK
jgi:predicted HTH transcriptional regulator